MEIPTVVPPVTIVFDIVRLGDEGLAMLYVFMPNYKNQPEGELSNVARAELARRGALDILSDTEDVWHLDEETKAEMFDVWNAHHLLHTFMNVVRPASANELHNLINQ